MRSRYRILERAHCHFITGTTGAGLSVFSTAARCDILVNAFEHCRQHKGLKLYAWVILDTHFHAIVAAPDLTRVLADLKRHTARRIIEQLEAEHCDWLLSQLRSKRSPSKTESQHQVWQEGSHPKAIMSDAITLQKLEYLHNNPVKRGLVASPEHHRGMSGYRVPRSHCGATRGGKLRQFNCRDSAPFRSATSERGWGGGAEPASGTPR